MANMGSAVPMFRSLAPRLAREFFTCRQCLATQPLNSATKSAFRKNFFSTVPSAYNARRINATSIQSSARQAFSSSIKRWTSGSAVANAVEEGSSKAKSSFPQVTDKKVAYWLLGSAVSVFGIVVFGGLTRLTESGYAIFCALPQVEDGGQLLTLVKSEYYRMAPRHWFPPSYERRGLGV